jgi:transaldolase
MQASTEPVQRRLDPQKAKAMDIKKVSFDEKSFRWALNDDPCACCKLPEGIRNFAKDTVKLEQLIKSKMA